MTTMLEKAFSEASHLTEEQQDQLACMILDVIQDDTRWDEAFRTSSDRLTSMAAEALAEYEQGETRSCGPEEA